MSEHITGGFKRQMKRKKGCMDHSKNTISEREKHIISGQLGREPENALAIVRRCSAGFPQLLLVHPFRGENVFPTIYWLSCPELNDRISRLEDRGLLAELTRREKENGIFGRRMEAAHKNYARRRRELMCEDDWEGVKALSDDALKTLRHSGVAGIRTSSGLKCLHAHFAHFMAGGENPAGERTAALLNRPWLCRRCCSLDGRLC